MSSRRDPASFRDPFSSVWLETDRACRTVRGPQAEILRKALASGVVQELMHNGDLIEVTGKTAGPADEEVTFYHPLLQGVTYPYEWSFGMLKAAALLHLKVHKALLADGFTLRDGSAYNVTFRGTKPVFIDFGSIGIYEDGDAWLGYSQFCALFLYPLMVAAYKGLDHRLFLRASIDGLKPETVRKLLAPSIRPKPGRLRFVVIPAILEARLMESHVPSRQVKTPKAVLLKLLNSLEHLIEKLNRKRLPRGVWSDYGSREHYEQLALETKAEFVRDICAEKPHSEIWDLGANDGMFSRIAIEAGGRVLAVDLDESVVDRNYENWKSDPLLSTKITPLVVSLTDSTNSLGWIAGERTSLRDRFKPDLVLYLAIAHHVGITGHVPIADQLEAIFQTTSECIFELPLRSDPKVQFLARNFSESHLETFTETHLKSVLPRGVEVVRELRVNQTRMLFHLVRLTYS